MKTAEMASLLATAAERWPDGEVAVLPSMLIVVGKQEILGYVDLVGGKIVLNLP